MGEEGPSVRRVWLGRSREIRALEAGLDALARGQGGLFLVTGEPGIGKSRLAEEVAQRASGRGLGVHWGRAWEAGGAPSYWPFIQILRAVCGDLDDRDLREVVGGSLGPLVELVPELRARVSGADEAQPSRERFELFDAITRFLHAAARRNPLVLILDDLHAADPSSVSLLHFLARDLRSGAVMAIATYREAEARLDADVHRALTLASREATSLPLRRLDRGEVAEFIAQATGVAPSDERVDALNDKSEGNPLFLRELLQLMGAGGARAAAPASLPDGTREVLRARVALLSPDVRPALEVAAVIGREIDVDLLASCASTTDVDAALRSAADAAVVEPHDPSRWRFTHVLLRESLYEQIDAPRRAALHASVARALARRATSPLAEIAHHLLNAVPSAAPEEAIDAALRAADQAMDLMAFEDAGVLMVRAAKHFDPSREAGRREFEVLLRLGVARIRAGEVARGKETCMRSAAIARRLQDGALFAQAVLGSTCEFTPGVRDDGLIALLEEALDVLPRGDGALRARCMAQLAAERQPEPDTAPPMELARAAVAMARRVGDVGTLRFVLSLAGLAMLPYGDLQERLALDREALALATAAGDKVAAQRAHLLLTGNSLEGGDPASARAHFRACEELLRLRHAGYRWLGELLQAQQALWEGRFDDAERLHREARESAASDEARGTTAVAFPLGLHLARERYCDRDALEAPLRAGCSAMSPELGACVGEIAVTQLHARAGDVARTTAQLALVKAQPVFARIREASWLAMLAEAAHLLADVPLADRLYAALQPRRGRLFWLGPMGVYYEPPYDRHLGLLAEVLGRLDDAVAHLREAEARTEALGMRSHLARVRYELAGVLAKRGRGDDGARAASLLATARSLAAELDQRELLRRIEARIGAAVPDVGPGRAGERPSIAPGMEPASAMSFRREGDSWAIAWRGRTVRLRDSRGLQVLVQLVASPGQELHVLQLVGSADGVADDGDAGEVLDAAAVQSYRARLLDLREDLEEAEGFGDAARAERARVEIDALTQELARAVGLGGRARRAGGAAERARTTVQKRLRGAIRRIEEELPDLGRHLDQTIRTGAFCGYLPDGRKSARRP